MMVATRDFAAVLDGERHEFTAGQTRVEDKHWAAVDYPEFFEPESARSAAMK
jgi:hypothetical protein